MCFHSAEAGHRRRLNTLGEAQTGSAQSTLRGRENTVPFGSQGHAASPFAFKRRAEMAGNGSCLGGTHLAQRPVVSLCPGMETRLRQTKPLSSTCIDSLLLNVNNLCLALASTQTMSMLSGKWMAPGRQRAVVAIQAGATPLKSQRTAIIWQCINLAGNSRPLSCKQFCLSTS